VGDKITSVAGLRKAIDKYTQLYFPKGAEDYGKGLKDGSRIALEKISEFEASVREDLKERLPFTCCKNIFSGKSKDYSHCGTCPRLAFCALLRRILGGEG